MRKIQLFFAPRKMIETLLQIWKNIFVFCIDYAFYISYNVFDLYLIMGEVEFFCNIIPKNLNCFIEDFVFYHLKLSEKEI